jgi:hypothetical protein
MESRLQRRPAGEATLPLPVVPLIESRPPNLEGSQEQALDLATLFEEEAFTTLLAEEVWRNAQPINSPYPFEFVRPRLRDRLPAGLGWKSGVSLIGLLMVLVLIEMGTSLDLGFVPNGSGSTRAQDSESALALGSRPVPRTTGAIGNVDGNEETSSPRPKIDAKLTEQHLAQAALWWPGAGLVPSAVIAAPK